MFVENKKHLTGADCGVRGAMRRGLAAALLVLLVLLALLARAAVADLVFRVPEVLVTFV